MLQRVDIFALKLSNTNPLCTQGAPGSSLLSPAPPPPQEIPDMQSYTGPGLAVTFTLHLGTHLGE